MEKTVLVMCANPTADGYYELPDHKFVAYVDITPVINTQAEHLAQIKEFRTREQQAIDKYTRLLAHPEEIQEDDEMRWLKENLKDVVGEKDTDIIRFQLDGSRFNLEAFDALKHIPLPVEELSKIYYQGIDSVPADLKVDVVFSAACAGESADKDQVTAIKRHLRPGGQLYLTVDPSHIDGAYKSRHKELFRLFAPKIEFTKLPFHAPYFEARGAFYKDQIYGILTRLPDTGGRRLKTFRHRSKRKSTRKGKFGAIKKD